MVIRSLLLVDGKRAALERWNISNFQSPIFNPNAPR